MKPPSVTCTLCNSLARRHLNLWQCRRNPRHIADLNALRWFVCGEKGN